MVTFDINNCFVCLLSSKYDIFRLIFPLEGVCPHGNKFVRKTCYRISLVPLFLNCCLFLFTVTTWITYLIYVPEACATNKPFCLLLLGDGMVVSIHIFSTIFLMLNLKLQLSEFNAWIKLFETRKLFGLRNITTLEVAKRVIRNRDIYLSSNFISVFVGSAVAYSLPYDYLPWNTLRNFARVMCYSFQGYVTLDLNQKIRIVGLVLDTFKHTIQEALVKNTYPVFSTKEGHLSLERFLGRCSSFVHVIYTNMGLFIQYMRVILVLYCTATISSLILNIYILLDCNDINGYILFATEVRTLYMIQRILSVCTTAEDNLKVKVRKSVLCFRLITLWSILIH